VALVQILNSLGSLKIQNAKNSPSHNFLRLYRIFANKARIGNWKKTC